MQIRCSGCGQTVEAANGDLPASCPSCSRPLHSSGAEGAAGAAPATKGDLAAIRALHEAYRKMRDELSKAIIGQDAVIEQVLIAIFSRAHALLVGVPGLAKTLLVSSLAQVMELTFKRIQFTPDLMPSDITGTEVLQEDPKSGKRLFKFLPGPVFANVILADEINRTPPKTQAALLESMQERQVTYGGTTYPLPDPFFVLATQNPIEQEGTYPLPEAQLDRFMFEVRVDYPSRAEELEIMKVTTVSFIPVLRRVLGGKEILNLQDIVRKVPVADHIYQYVADLVRATRPRDEVAPEWIKEWVQWGAGPRACQYLVLGAKARAILHGRYHVTTEDVMHVAPPVLRHRVIVNFNAEAEGLSSDDIVERLLKEIPHAPEPVKTR